MKHFVYSTFILLLVMISADMMAQNDVRQQINDIKLDAEYIWEEARDVNAETAKNFAYQGLLIKINEGRQAELQLEDIAGKAHDLQMPRGDKTLVFAYIRKTELTNINPSTEPVTQETTPDVSVIPSSPQLPASSDSVSTPTSASPTITNNNASSSVVMSLLEREMITEVAKCLKEYKAEGRITEMGMSRPDSAPDDANVVLYGEDRSVLAIFGKKLNGKRKNITTNTDENIGDYKKCGALWFK